MVCTIRTRRWLGPLGLRTLAALLAAAAGSPAFAQAKPGVAITSPSHGAVLADGEVFYLAGTQQVRVQGAVGGVPAGDIANWVVVVQGVIAPALTPVAGTTDQYTFSTLLWIGPDVSTAPGGAVPAGYLAAANMLDTRRIHKPIIVELINIPSNTTASRSRVELHDMRFGGGDPRTTTPTESEGVAFQLTTSGLDGLEPPHAQTMPFPTLDVFNASLEARADGISHSVTMGTRFGSNNKACFPLTRNSPFLSTSEYELVLTEALAHYAAYEAAQEAQQTGAAWLPAGFVPALIVQLGLQAYLTSECVQEPPVRASQFEVCIGTMNGEMTDLAIAGVDDIDLTFGDKSRHVNADVTLGRVTGTVKATMADVFLRWAVRHRGCSLRPEKRVADTTLTSTEALRTWSTCEGLRAEASAARTVNYTTGVARPFDFLINRGSDREFLDVTRSGTKGKFALHPDRVEFADVGTCFGLLSESYSLLRLFYPDMQAVLNTTWVDGSPATQQAQALDELTAALEVGRVHAPDLSFDYTYNVVQSTVAFPGGGAPTPQFPAPDGLIGTATTNAKVDPSVKILPPWSTWVRAEPVVLDQIFSPDGQSYFNTPFDVAYTVTTNTFNQMIRERSGTDLLYFTLQPTWADLGMASGPAGEPATEPAVLTGALLAQHVHPSFAVLGNSTVAINARPTTLPFTFVPPDQPSLSFPQFQFGRAPVTYQLGQFRLDVTSDNPTMPHVFTMFVDMFDDELQVHLSGTPGSRTLDVALQNDQWRMFLPSTNLACPLTPYTPIGGGPPPPACEGAFVTAFSGLVQPTLRDKLTRLLQGLPAPQVWEVPSATSQQLRELHQVDSFVDRQRIALFGTLRAPQ